jgi:DNA-binding IclR family transcriptional regulator
MSDAVSTNPDLQPEAISHPRATQYAAPALEKGLDILELLSGEEEGLTRKDMAERLGRSVGEIFRMIDCLVRRAYIAPVGDVFILSTRLFELSHSFPPTKRLLSEAAPRMRALAERAEQSCHLSVLSGASQLVIAQADTPDGVGFSIKVGSKLDILKSASGLLLLAFQDPSEAERLMMQLSPEMPESERIDTREALQRIRSQKFTDMKSRQFSGVRAISYPIFDLNGHATAALTIPYIERLDDDRRPSAPSVQLQLSRAASELNAAMGVAIPYQI